SFIVKTLRSDVSGSWRDHSALMPAARITVPHFSVLSATSLSSWAGEATNTVLAMSATRAAMLGSASAALIALFSLSMSATGVSLGTPTPIHPVTSYPGRKSPTTGTSGSHGKRVALVTASARSLPALMYPMDDWMLSKATDT